MAEAVVLSVLQKLAEVVIQEARFLQGVENQVEDMKCELIRIQCFLKDADSKRKGDNRIENWVKEVRDVSFWIEDVIDTFLIDIQQIPPKEPGMINKLKRLGKKTGKAVLLHKLGDEINKIQERIRKIYASRETYGIQNLGQSSTESVNRLRRQIVVPNIDKDIIGFEDEKKKITELLVDPNVLRRHVVSIVGQGGLGKTTLTQKIYNSTIVKNHFDIRIWLTISQEFTTIQLLKDLLRELGETDKSKMDRDEAYFIGEIHESLSNKRYVVVLDDIWKDYVWSDIFQQVFPDAKNGSRVLITTRFSTIANMADPKGVQQLRFLNNEESLALILEKAFPRENDSECYPPDLSEVAKEFVKICGGLPLALVVVGGMLLTKYPNYSDGYKVLETMDWRTDGNKCREIIATSYEDLPLHLKSCFIYLASFPEDYAISAEHLISLWIAEGLIPDEGGKVMEDIGEKYLKELAERCMIQVLERSDVDGSIKILRVHDLLRDLAIDEAKDKNLLKVFSKQDDFQNVNDARRVTFQLEDSSWEKTAFHEKQLIEYIKPNVRSLFFFGKVIPISSKFQLLRVLFLQNCKIYSSSNSLWANSLKGMVHLRCLVFEDCEFEDFILPVEHLCNLQTLQIICCEGIDLPMSIWRIKTLRNIIVTTSRANSFKELGSTPLNLPNLQTLGVVVVDGPRIDVLNMPSLHHLYLDCKGDDAWKSIVALLVKLDSLVSLEIDIDSPGSIPNEIIDTRAFPSYPYLQSLLLYGDWQLKGALIVDMFPPHLIKLTIEDSHINQDLMPVLEKLPCLKVLIMPEAYKGKEMICSKGGFSRLKILNIYWFDELEEWKIEEGAMPMLEHLKILKCDKMKMVPDLHHVPTLKILELIDMKEEFNQRARNEDEYKIRHIPSITIRD